jgi:WYL domain
MKMQESHHPYREQAALDRLLLLITTLLRHPGIGCPDEDDSHIKEEHHSALALVATQLQKLALAQGYSNIADSVPTLRKDLEFLRKYQIIEDRMYRWGYFLGTGVFTRPELQVAIHALKDVGQQLGDPAVNDLHQKLTKRLRGVEFSEEIIYPVRSQLNRVIVSTDPEQMRSQGIYQETLFDRLTELENAIVAGQPIELYYRQSPYQNLGQQFLRVYPLQLLYYDVAWYLITEDVESGYLAAVRLDRLSSHLQNLEGEPRGKKMQLDQLKAVHRLLQVGWGISLGSVTQQQQELAGATPVKVKVRFFAEVAPFIKEGNKRHPRQKIHEKHNTQGKLEYVDYSVNLPDRALADFFRWVRRFGSQAVVLSPPESAQQFRDEALLLAARYAVSDNN